MLRSFAFWLLVLALTAIAWLSWQRVEQLTAESILETAQTPASVEVAPARRGMIHRWVYGEGTARAARREFMRFQATGKVVFIGTDQQGHELRPGARVHGPEDQDSLGQMLAQLDRRDTAEAFTMSQARKLQAERSVETAEAAMAQAQTELDLADRDLRRMQDLRKQGVIALKKLEEARARYTNAASSLRSARSELHAARSAVIEAEARMRQASIELERTAIFAPFDGIIAYMNVRLGDLVSPSLIDTSSEQRMLETTPVVLIDPSVFEVTIDLPAFDGMLVEEGQQAVVSFSGDLLDSDVWNETSPAGREGLAPASVFSVSPAISPGGRTIQVKLRTDQAGSGLQDGMFVVAWIAVEEKADAVLAPNAAWLYAKDKPYVFVADPQTSTVQRREIKDGIEGVPQSEIRAGVEPGELLVTKGRHMLTDGATVMIVRKAGRDE